MLVKHLNKGAVSAITSALGRDSKNLIHTVDTWISCSGIEWTCNRLKAIRTGLYQLKAGNPDVTLQIWRDNSIAYHKDTMLPKGHFGLVGKRYLASKQPKNLRKYDLVLRLYTSLRNAEVSEKQFSKAKSAITADFSGDHQLVGDLSRAIEREVQDADLKLKVTGKPDLSRLKRYSSTHKEGTIPREILDLPWGRHLSSLWTSTFLPPSLKGLNPSEELRNELELSGANSTTAGHIAFLQEGGCKGRVVAVPNAWIQCILKPVEDSIDKLVQTLPESCSHDQSRGAYFLQQALKEGRVYCYDLSSATDRFPIAPQLAVLRAMGRSDIASAIQDISRGEWKVSTPFGEETWSYNVGQPMGLYCSFKLFHLTHILMLRSIEREHKKECGTTFRVLGDDVIITDKDIAHTYQSWMTGLGVELSTTKSLISDSMGEFAGFVAYKHGNSVHVHRPFKYTDPRKPGSAMNLIFSLSENVRSIGPWYAKAYEIFRETIKDRNPDLSPIVTVDREVETETTIDSHYMGSLSNRISYFLPYEVSEKVLDIFELQQIRLLGEKEKVNEDGFASKGDNNLYGQSFAKDIREKSQKDYVSEFAYRVSLLKDPLYKDQRYRMKSAVN